MSRWFSRVLGLALLLGEGAAAFAALFCPHVGPFYHDYYISRARLCWLPAGEAARIAADLARADDVELAALTPPEACYMLMQGWDGRNIWGETSHKPLAQLDVPVPPGVKAATLTLVALSPTRPEKLDVYVDGRFWRTLTLPPGLRPSAVTIPAPDQADMIIALGPDHYDKSHGIGLVRVAWTK